MIKLLKRISDNNILLEIIDGKLKVFASGSDLDSALIAEIKDKKEDLLQYLLKSDQKQNQDSFITIPALPQQVDYELSSSQRRLWVLGQLEEGNIAYNMPGVRVFEGDLNIQALEESFNLLISRHESLRTIFRENSKGELRQVILSAEESLLQLGYHDFDGLVDAGDHLNVLIRTELSSPFELSSGPLLRACLFRISDKRFVFTYVMHHIISDGWSMHVLIRELLLTYNSLVQGQPYPLLPLRIHYKDYAGWQQNQLESAAFAAHKAYWLAQFDGELPVLELAGDHLRPPVKTYTGAVIKKRFDAGLSKGLKSFVQQQGCTLFMGLLTGVSALLHRYTDQEDLIIGSPIAGREHVDLEEQIGFYINTLALRMRFKGACSSLELLAHVKEITLGGYEHQMYPFDELVDELSLKRDRSRSALFDVMVVLQNTQLNSREASPGLAGLTVHEYEGGEHLISKFDLTFSFIEVGEDLQVSIEYNTSIYDRGTIDQLGDHLEQIMVAMLAFPDLSLDELDYLTAKEKQTLLLEFNDTTVAYPKDKTIVDLFEAQVEKNPDHIAVVFENITLTYRELNERSNELAAYLLAHYSIQADDLIGIKLERSELLIIAILGVLKSGGAYVPIDPDYPEERIDYMLADSNCKVLIDEKEFRRMKAGGQHYSTKNPEVLTQSNNLAYVIYTSGSTGKPKGVMVEHHSIIRLVSSTNYLEFTTSQILLSTGSISFDATIFEYWGMLLNGGQLVLCRQEILTDSNLLADEIEKRNINIMWFTSGLLNQLVDTNAKLFQKLTTILAGGDVLSPVQINKLRSHFPALTIINGYGPTENTTFSLTYQIQNLLVDIPIGKPISNSTSYILDRNTNVVPIGVIGEICLGGDGLARGYLNQPMLTAEKFIPDPFRPGERLYRTGDLGRWHADGNIQFIGRKDNQVKIRGYRIESGEIENVLQRHPDISSTVVLAKPAKTGEQELIAYLVSSTLLSSSEIRSYLGKYLPVYMLPAHYVQLDSLPLTANGKVDRKNLPEPEGLGLITGTTYVAARNETEEQLLQIWQEILGKENISVKDNFFELGGHSLKATRLVSQIHKIFQVKVSLKELFTSVTLEEQAELLHVARRDSFITIPALPPQADYALSSSQRRLWVLGQLEEGNIAYNMPGVRVFEGDLNIQALEESFNLLISRHESLRTIFRENSKGELRQVILSAEESLLQLGYHDFDGLVDAGDHLDALIRTELSSPFELSSGPLLRACLFRISDKRFVFTYAMHHIISDGWSMHVLIRELLLTYNSLVQGQPYPLLPLRIHYKDYAGWQQNQLESAAFAAHQAYWLAQFDGELPVLELAGDHLRPPIKTYTGAVIKKRFDAGLSKGLKSFVQQQGCTLFMGLLTGVSALLHRYTGQEDLIIGSPIAGREHVDLEEQIGFYINTLAFRMRFKGACNSLELLAHVKEITLGGYEHQMYPFDELVDELSLKRDMSRSALFDVMVILQNTKLHSREVSPGLAGLTVHEYEGGEHLISKFDLTFNFIEVGEDLQVSIEYNTSIYDKVTIDQLGDHLEQIMGAMLAFPDLSLDELDYLTAKEKQTLLLEFNDTNVAYPKDKTIVDLFEAQVEGNPDHIAVVFENKTLTYRELNERSNELAAYLLAHYAIQADDLIGIKLERSELLIIAILGVLKSGAAYVPIDPDYPEERIKYLEQDSQCLLTIDAAYYEIFLNHKNNYHPSPLPVNISAGSLVYLIYTSGSTGNSKGIMMSHGAMVNLIKFHINEFSDEEVNAVLQFASISFDVSFQEIFTTLLRGATLYPISDVIKKDTNELVHFINQKNIDTVFLPTAYFKILIEEDYFLAHIKLTVRNLIVAGEQLLLTESAIKYLQTCNFKLHNHYGPAETHVVTTATLEGLLLTNIPVIGKPINNTQIYILSGRQLLTSLGVIGEIYIGGDGVARGYLNQPVLTAEKFIPDPFRPGERLYRTGDLGRWHADGNIQFIGRKDNQVKIRGYRIEPGEIENVLQRHPDISSAVVLAKPAKTGEQELIAYLVSSTLLNSSEIRSYLGKYLPVYMLPAHYVQLDSLPLTANGKVDRKKLPEPEGLGLITGTTYVAARNETEEQLLQIWQEILGKENISVKDNFFELGGHSLKATRLVSQIHKIFQVKVSLKELFTSVTLEEQAELLHVARRDSFITIPALPPQADYALSSSQRRLWVLGQLEEGNIAYNMPGVRVFEGDLNIQALEESFNLLISRHESLRTIFRENSKGELRQVVLSAEESLLRLGYHDFDGLVDAGDHLDALIRTELSSPFELSSGPLLRACLFRISDKRFVFTYAMHHIISDGWSMHVLIRELLLTYNSLVQGQPYPLLPLRIHYKDYAGWQQNQLESAAFAAHQAYWLAQFDGELPVLELVGDHLRPPIKTYTGAVIKKRFDAELSKGLKSFVQQQGCTLFMGLLTGVSALLHRYTGQEDLIIGSPIAGREHVDLEEQIGFYINTLAFRMRFKGACNSLELLAHVKEITLGDYEHQMYPFDELVDELSLKRDRSRSALFDVMVVLQNTQLNSREASPGLAGLTVHEYEGGEHLISKFDLTFSFIEVGEEIQVGITYNTSIYDRGTIDQLGDHLEQIMGAMLAFPDLSLDELDYLTAKEKQTLLLEFNDTNVAYPKDKTIVDLFEAQVEKNPDHIAVVFENTTLTYRELNERSNELAAYLLAHYSIQADDLIGIKLERSELLIIAILGVLKSGGAYVPVDPDYPEERIDYMLADSNCKVLIDEKEFRRMKAGGQHYSTRNPKVLTQSNNLAYVIYTSGSTGKPKGVMVEHLSIINYTLWFIDKFEISDHDSTPLLSTITFDGVLTSVFGALLSGTTLFIISKETLQHPVALSLYINNNDITYLKITPPLLKLLITDDESFKIFIDSEKLRLIIVGGEKINSNDLDKIKKKNKRINLVNHYGPTETTVGVTTMKIEQIKDLIPIGGPISNTDVYIINGKGKLQPVGVTGEICIGGSGLARGYLNQEKLTAAKFVADPFKKGNKIYKTGDLGRWLPDGNIEFLGRKDHQVKIRGYRIELGEIENVLQSHELIDSAVVLARPDHEGNDLVAYVISKTFINRAEIRSYMSKFLPVYMIPNQFLQLESIPLTINGKTHHQQLLSMADADKVNYKNADFVSASGALENILIETAKEVLKRDHISMNDNFFDLGGDSIKSIQIASRLRTKGYILKISDILRTPLISELSGKITLANHEIDQLPIQGNIILSPIQRRFLDSENVDQQHYNQSVLLHSKDRLDENIVREVFNKLFEHHDALRMTFKKTGDSWSQENLAIDELTSSKIFYTNNEANSFYTPFDKLDTIHQDINLNEGPLIRIGLLKKDDGDYLLITIHHLVVDGISWRILFEDIAMLFKQASKRVPLQLPLKTNSFKLWMEKQLAYSKNEALIQERHYWDKIESKVYQPIPVDYPEADILYKDLESISFSLSKENTQLFLSRNNSMLKTEINDLLLTALGVSIRSVFKLSEFVVSLEGHGREGLAEDLDVSRTVGWFTSVFPVVINSGISQDPVKQLIHIKEVLRQIPDKGIGYGILKYLSDSGGNYSLSPQIIFNYLGEFNTGISTDAEKSILEFSRESAGIPISPQRIRKEQLSVSGMLVDSVLKINISYSKKQYNLSTIKRISEAYESSLVCLLDSLSKISKKISTPSDFTYKLLSVSQLEDLTLSHGVIEDVYPLSPLQEGIYFHWLKDTGDHSYFQQIAYRIKGILDVEVLRKSYVSLINRHPVLRTCFTSYYGEFPLQIICETVNPDFVFHDISSKAYTEQKQLLESYKEKDKQKGFDLNKGSQMRLNLFKLQNDEYEFIWSHHHILIDGWGLGIVHSDLFALYNSQLSKQPSKLSEPVKYSKYIDWISKRDIKKSRHYWAEYLDGYQSSATIPVPVKQKVYEYKQSRETFTIPVDQVNSLKKMGTGYNLTMNTIIQGLWGVLLSKINHTNDVVFGAVVSGRPSELEQAEEILGLFINTVPVRVNYAVESTIIDLFKKLQSGAIDSEQHHYMQLAEIQSLNRQGKNLFDHILMFQNQPVEDSIKQADDSDAALKLLNLEVFEQTNYNFNITVIPKEELIVFIDYNGNIYNQDLIVKINLSFKELINEVILNPEKLITELLHDEIISGDQDFKCKAYLADCLSNALPVLNISKKKRTIPVLYKANKTFYKFDTNLVNSMNNVACKYGNKLADLLFANVNLLIHKYTGENNIAIGTCLNYQSQAIYAAEIKKVINYFPLITSFSDNMGITDFYATVKKNLSALNLYADDSLLEQVNHEMKDKQRIFSNIFFKINYLRGAEFQEAIVDASSEELIIGAKDIIFEFFCSDTALSLSLICNGYLFDAYEIELIYHKLISLLADVENDFLNDIKLNQIDCKIDDTKILDNNSFINVNFEENF